MSKIVAMINEDPEIAEVCKRIDQRKHFANKRMRDAEMHLRKIQEDLHETNLQDWKLVEDWLRLQGRLPDHYNLQTHSISFNLKNNGISVSSSEEMPSGFRGMEGMKGLRIEDLPSELREALISFIRKDK